MRILIFCFFCFAFWLNGNAQDTVKYRYPNEFPVDVSPSDSDAFYTQEGASPRKMYLSDLKENYFGVTYGGAIAYTPAATGNANNNNQFVVDPSGYIYYIDVDGKGIQITSAKTVDTNTRLKNGRIVGTDLIHDIVDVTTNTVTAQETIDISSLLPQTLNIVGSDLTISGGNTITIPSGASDGVTTSGVVSGDNIDFAVDGASDYSVDITGLRDTVTVVSSDTSVVITTTKTGNNTEFDLSVTGNSTSTYDAGNGVIVTGSTGIVSTFAAGKHTITVPDGGVLSAINDVPFSNATATFTAVGVSDGLAVRVVHLDGTTMWGSSPLVMKATNNIDPVSDSNPYTVEVNSSFDFVIMERVAGATTYAFKQLTTRASTGGSIQF